MTRQINPGGGLGVPYFVQEDAVDSVGNVPEEAASTFTKLANFYGSTPFGNASIGFVNVMQAKSDLPRESARDNLARFPTDVDYYYLGFLPQTETYYFYLITAGFQETSFTEDRIGSTLGLSFHLYTRDREASSIEFWPADIPDTSYEGFTGRVGSRMTFGPNDGFHRRDDPERHEVYLKVYHYNSRGNESVYAVLYSTGREIEQEDLRDIYERVVLLQQRYDETGSLGVNPGGDFHLPRVPAGVDSDAWRDLSGFIDPSWYAERFPDIDFPRGNPLGHFWDQWRAGVRVDPHPLFLTEHYVGQNPGVDADDINPILHYLERWRSEPGLSPHPLFDGDFYVNRHGDLLQGDTNPIQHYSNNWATNSSLDPHPLFSTSFYVENIPDFSNEGVSPLYHYWTRWQTNPNLDPHPLFDTGHYVSLYPDVSAASVNPLQHFVQFGWREGRSPHPLFDNGFYLDRNPDVAATVVNPLIHYLDHGGSEGRDPHALFDSSFYLEQNPDVTGAGMNPLLHYMLHGEQAPRNPHPLFDNAFYLAAHADVAAAGVNPLVHYIQFGWQEGRNPHPLFDTAFYLQSNPDVAQAGINPLSHYFRFGGLEGRAPSREFDGAFYLAANPDVAQNAVNPLVHYLLYGRVEGRLPLPPEPQPEPTPDPSPDPDPTPDIPGDTTTQTVALDDTFGVLDFVGDVDWYRVDLDSPTRSRILLRPAIDFEARAPVEADIAIEDLAFAVFDERGRYVLDFPDFDTAGTITDPATRAASLFDEFPRRVSVFDDAVYLAVSSRSGATGTYAFDVEVVDIDDRPNLLGFSEGLDRPERPMTSGTTLTPFAPGRIARYFGSTDSFFGADYADYFRFRIDEPRNVDFVLRGSAHSLDLIGPSTFQQDDRTRIVADLAPGIYDLGVEALVGGSYTLDIYW